ncbi:hypothetical protein [Bartonella sp. AU55XJBT]|uniref:hypothetical protein n=1 Tax=Bartonella sp. AU55XJBT TaxID=3019091 RepID=UPI002360899D|nr:hypothetical protein [Bartonella sp. AU55XJBT]
MAEKQFFLSKSERSKFKGQIQKFKNTLLKLIKHCPLSFLLFNMLEGEGLNSKSVFYFKNAKKMYFEVKRKKYMLEIYSGKVLED